MALLLFAAALPLVGLLMWLAGAFEDPIVTADRVARVRHAYLRRTDPELVRLADRYGAAAAYTARRHDYPAG